MEVLNSAVENEQGNTEGQLLIRSNCSTVGKSVFMLSVLLVCWISKLLHLIESFFINVEHL